MVTCGAERPTVCDAYAWRTPCPLPPAAFFLRPRRRPRAGVRPGGRGEARSLPHRSRKVEETVTRWHREAPRVTREKGFRPGDVPAAEGGRRRKARDREGTAGAGAGNLPPWYHIPEPYTRKYIRPLKPEGGESPRDETGSPGDGNPGNRKGNGLHECHAPEERTGIQETRRGRHPPVIPADGNEREIPVLVRRKRAQLTYSGFGILSLHRCSKIFHHVGIQYCFIP